MSEKGSYSDPKCYACNNPNGYWCQPCGRSREHAEQWCSSAYCKERRNEEDLEKESPRPDYRFWSWQ